MAGDWIKVECTTPDKPEVSEMAEALGLTPDDVVGKLLRVWIWADQQSLDGHAVRVTSVTLSSHAGHTKFAQAMRDVGWLTGEERALTFPKFDRHNGEPAKKRALAKDRKREQRSREKEDSSVTREEKRRSTTTPPSPPASQGGHPADAGKAKPKRATRWWKSPAGIVAKGKELGIEARLNESMDAYADRLQAAIQASKTADRSPPSPPVRESPRVVTLPPSWAVTLSLQQIVQAVQPTWTSDHVETMAGAFRASMSKLGAEFADWDAAFVTWCGAQAAMPAQAAAVPAARARQARAPAAAVTPAAAAVAKPKAWWETPAGIVLKANEQDMTRGNEPFEVFEARLFARMGPGPWTPKDARKLALIEQFSAKAPPPPGAG